MRDWFRARCEALGGTVTVDDMARCSRAVQGSVTTPANCDGSHLDTQPTGGKFDGVLGVLGALEALRTLVQAGYETFAPIEVINWTNEEGSRFAPAMVASGVFAGAFTQDWAMSREDRGGITFGSALDAIGYRGSEKCGSIRCPPSSNCTRAGADPRRRTRDSYRTGVLECELRVTVTGESAHTSRRRCGCARCVLARPPGRPLGRSRNAMRHPACAVVRCSAAEFAQRVPG